MVVIASQDDRGSTLGIPVSSILALWSASGGVAAPMQAMNMAYHQKETRHFLSGAPL
jgi:uncharacterized BrkB/YihY/UPF0761 family membrane protein